MKIAYLLQEGVPDVRQTPLSGPANHVVRVIEEFKKNGHHVRLLMVFDHKIWSSDDLKDFRIVSVRWLDHGPIRLFERIIRHLQSKLRLPYFAFFDSLRFALACRQELSGYDLFYERMGWMGYGGGLASRLMKIPLVLEVNGDHLTELRHLGMEPKGAQRKISIFLMDKAIKMSSHIIATGEGWKKALIERWGTASDQVSVVENGSEMVHLLQRDQLRCFHEGNKQDETVNLVYVGGFEPWHGLTILIQAFSSIVEQGLPAHLNLVGSGTLWDELQAQVHDLRIEASVSFLGHKPMEQVAKILSQADIGMSPYCGREEYSGLKLLDYKAAGLATIASGARGQPAVIEHGRTGLIVTPCSNEELFDAIVQLCTNCELRKQMGRQARIEAEELHSWSQTVTELEKIFNQLNSI